MRDETHQANMVLSKNGRPEILATASHWIGMNGK